MQGKLMASEGLLRTYEMVFPSTRNIALSANESVPDRIAADIRPSSLCAQGRQRILGIGREIWNSLLFLEEEGRRRNNLEQQAPRT